MATQSVAVEEVGQLARTGQDIGRISQWTLMRRRFMENKLSVVGGIILIVMYLMAGFAPFLSPYPYDELDSNSIWSAPTAIYMVNGRPSVCSVSQSLDTNTFTFVSHLDCTKAYPVKLFVHGYSYTLFGIIPSDVHLFGVDAPAKLFLFGTDGQGRDMLSRLLEGSRISLSVGLVGVALAIIFGSVLGTVSGYLGGATDNLIQR